MKIVLLGLIFSTTAFGQIVDLSKPIEQTVQWSEVVNNTNYFEVTIPQICQTSCSPLGDGPNCTPTPYRCDYIQRTPYTVYSHTEFGTLNVTPRSMQDGSPLTGMLSFNKGNPSTGSLYFLYELIQTKNESQTLGSAIYSDLSYDVFGHSMTSLSVKNARIEKRILKFETNSSSLPLRTDIEFRIKTILGYKLVGTHYIYDKERTTHEIDIKTLPFRVKSGKYKILLKRGVGLREKSNFVFNKQALPEVLLEDKI